MRLKCVNCKTAFIKDDPAKIICSDDGIFFFCDQDCKDKFVYPVGQKDDFENWKKLPIDDLLILFE